MKECKIAESLEKMTIQLPGKKVDLDGFFFFFSSRRRHTRWNCDWSSDVCSSDLLNVMGSNFLSKAEVDVDTIRRASIVAVDSIEQSKMEAGDLMPAIERGVLSWDAVDRKSVV